MRHVVPLVLWAASFVLAPGRPLLAAPGPVADVTCSVRPDSGERGTCVGLRESAAESPSPTIRPPVAALVEPPAPADAPPRVFSFAPERPASPVAGPPSPRIARAPPVSI